MSTSWRRLHLSKTAGLPPLLYKYISTPTSYEIYMTDLTNIWSERMTRQAILKRADETDATIDPSEDAEQFKMLLQKINDALQNTPGSSTTLLQHNSTSASASSLELITTTKLPAPLEPLKWTLKLSKESPSATTLQLLLPLIEAEVSRTSRQQTLIDELSKKDWVLGKLFDKIETVGIDLSTIFPGMSGLRAGRKGTTLTQAAKYIKGVAPFDEQAWLDEVRRSSDDADLASNIFAEVAGSGSDRGDDAKLRPPPEAWWEGLSTVEQDRTPSSVQEDIPEPEVKPSKEDVELDTDTGAETEDDEFERQETPPRLKRPQSPKASTEKAIEKGQETETDDESPPGSPLPTRQKPAPKPTKGLGVIGGSKRRPPRQPSAQPESIANPSPSKPKRHIPITADNNDDDKTDSGSGSGSDDLEDHAPPPPRESPKPKPTAKPRGLGVIGGKKKQPTPVPPPATPSLPPQSPTSKAPTDQAPETSPVPASKPKRLGKLGVIGGKASKPRTDTAQPATETPSRSAQVQASEKDVRMEETRRPKLEATRSPSPAKEAPPAQPEEPKKEETEQERADRKREELKRQLEAKAKAPAKKKRRF